MIDSRTSGRWENTTTRFGCSLMALMLAAVSGITHRACRDNGKTPFQGMRHTPADPTGRAHLREDIMRLVTAPTISQRVHSLNRPNMVSVGTIVWLSSELMFFAGLFAMFFTI